MTTEPFKVNLDAAQALADAATPGEWFVDEVAQSYGEDIRWMTIVGGPPTDENDGAHELLAVDLRHCDAEFMAQARTLVPALIAELRETRDALAQSEERNSNLFDLGNKHLDAIDRVEALTTEWETKAGPGSKAWEVYGPQNVSVPFAVKSIRAALEGGK